MILIHRNGYSPLNRKPTSSIRLTHYLIRIEEALQKFFYGFYVKRIAGKYIDGSEIMLWPGMNTDMTFFQKYKTRDTGRLKLLERRINFREPQLTDNFMQDLFDVGYKR